MSYQTWHDYGYGLCVSKLQIDSVERIQKLLEKAPEYNSEISSWLAEAEIEKPTIEDYLDFDQDFHNGIAAIIKEVIQEAEGIEFLACDDFEGNRYLIYSPSYPWFLQDKEKELTEDIIKNILTKYVSIVTEDELVIEYCAVENGG